MKSLELQRERTNGEDGCGFNGQDSFFIFYFFKINEWHDTRGGPRRMMTELTRLRVGRGGRVTCADETVG